MMLKVRPIAEIWQPYVIQRYIEDFYNPVCLLASIGYLSPMALQAQIFKILLFTGMMTRKARS